MSQLRKDLQMTSDTRMMQNIKYQLRHIEAELVAVRQQLAESSKVKSLFIGRNLFCVTFLKYIRYCLRTVSLLGKFHGVPPWPKW